MTDLQSPLIDTTIRLQLHVEAILAQEWRLERHPDHGLMAVDTTAVFDRSAYFGPIPYTEAEFLHGLREEIMGTVPGFPFTVVQIRRVAC